MKKLLLLAFFSGFVLSCGSWVADPGPAFCNEKDIKEIKEQIAKNKLGGINAALLNGTCGQSGKIFAGDVRCSASGVHEVKCK